MVEPTQQPERRRRPRALADFAVTLTIEGREHAATMRDLSELGLRCTAPLRLAPRTELEVAFALPGRSDVLRIRARTVRCVAIDAAGSEFTVGLKFAEVPPLSRAAILGYVAKGKRAP